MIKLNYTIVNELDEYELISNSKQSPSRENLISLKPNITPHYREYSNNFNNIHNKAANVFTRDESIELKNCYDNSTAALDDLKVRLVKSQNNIFKFLCPYCLIMYHSTFDHYIPKEEQPVFSVYAKNLIPCCSVCNNKKLQYWKEANQRAIIHFYIDILPNEQFLFCNLSFNGSIPILKFNLLFSNGFDPAIKLRIEKHFRRLNLINRYDETAPNVLSNIHIDIESLSGITPTVNEMKIFLLNKADNLFREYGKNFWKAVAYKTLATDNNYLTNLIS